MPDARRPIAVLFDLDGTLVDTVGLILASVRHAFDGYGACPSDAEWIAGIGTPLRTQLAALARQPEDVELLVARYREHHLEHHDRMTRCFADARETVALLAGRGHPIGVVTAKTEEGARRTLGHVGLLGYVRAIVAADSGPRPKPHPDAVVAALERLGRRPEEAVFVGDSPHDVAAGNAAGVVTVGAAWGACSEEALREAGVRHVLRAIGELPGLIARMGGGGAAFRG